MREKVHKIITEWDPVDLTSFLVPDDEYSAETDEIVSICNKNVSQRELSQIIYDVFLRNFGKDIFNYSIEECSKIANKILENW